MKELEKEKEEIGKAILNLKEKMKKDLELFNSKRKATLTWSIIFFIGILITTIFISIITKGIDFEIVGIFEKLSSKEIPLFAITISLVASFLTGSVGSYFRTKTLNNSVAFNVKDFITESYLDRINKSDLNPQRK